MEWGVFCYIDDFPIRLPVPFFKTLPADSKGISPDDLDTHVHLELGRMSD